MLEVSIFVTLLQEVAKRNNHLEAFFITPALNANNGKIQANADFVLNASTFVTTLRST